MLINFHLSFQESTTASTIFGLFSPLRPRSTTMKTPAGSKRILPVPESKRLFGEDNTKEGSSTNTPLVNSGLLVQNILNMAREKTRLFNATLTQWVSALMGGFNTPRDQKSIERARPPLNSNQVHISLIHFSPNIQIHK